MTLRNQVAAAETPSPSAAPMARSLRCCVTPSASTLIHNASSASGSAANSANPNATGSKRGSALYASPKARSIERKAGGMSSILGRLACCIKLDFLLARLFAVAFESRCLQFEHGAIPSALRHQFVVRAELDYPAVFQYANAIRLTNRREPMRDQNRGYLARRFQDAFEDFGFAAHVELSGRLVQQNQASAHAHRAQCTS